MEGSGFDRIIDQVGWISWKRKPKRRAPAQRPGKKRPPDPRVPYRGQLELTVSELLPIFRLDLDPTTVIELWTQDVAEGNFPGAIVGDRRGTLARPITFVPRAGLPLIEGHRRIFKFAPASMVVQPKYVGLADPVGRPTVFVELIKSHRTAIGPPRKRFIVGPSTHQAIEVYMARLATARRLSPDVPLSEAIDLARLLEVANYKLNRIPKA